ncbi:MAG TPA: SDR family oxidoreductase [Bryobacteraceae bacterium]
MAERELNGSVIVITGASSGFGKGAALGFAAKGAVVVLAARRDQLLADIARDCESAGGRALAVPTDVSREEEVSHLAAQAVSTFGRIDVWVNNAGAGAIGPFADIPLEDHVKVIQTDLLGTLYGSYFAMRQFRTQSRGTLINVASVIGKIPSPYFASYAAAKHGVVGLSTSLRQELQEEKTDAIHVCTVMPTSFDTPFFEHAAQYTGREASPIPPTYDPKEVVDTIVGLASEPKDEIIVGTAAKVFNVAHHLFPGVVEAIMARKTRKSEFDDAQPGEVTSGSLHKPMAGGTGVTGGWKK